MEKEVHSENLVVSGHLGLRERVVLEEIRGSRRDLISVSPEKLVLLDMDRSVLRENIDVLQKVLLGMVDHLRQVLEENLDIRRVGVEIVGVPLQMITKGTKDILLWPLEIEEGQLTIVRVHHRKKDPIIVTDAKQKVLDFFQKDQLIFIEDLLFQVPHHLLLDLVHGYPHPKGQPHLKVRHNFP